MDTTRRGFIGALAVAGAALGLSESRRRTRLEVRLPRERNLQGRGYCVVDRDTGEHLAKRLPIEHERLFWEARTGQCETIEMFLLNPNGEHYIDRRHGEVARDVLDVEFVSVERG